MLTLTFTSTVASGEAQSEQLELLLYASALELTCSLLCSVLKALCVGAKGVGIGRAALYSSVSFASSLANSDPS